MKIVFFQTILSKHIDFKWVLMDNGDGRTFSNLLTSVLLHIEF